MCRSGHLSPEARSDLGFLLTPVFSGERVTYTMSRSTDIKNIKTYVSRFLPGYKTLADARKGEMMVLGVVLRRGGIKPRKRCLH